MFAEAYESYAVHMEKADGGDRFSILRYPFSLQHLIGICSNRAYLVCFFFLMKYEIPSAETQKINVSVAYFM